MDMECNCTECHCDDMDGCEIDYAAEALTEEEQDLFPLFPDGPDPVKEAEWKELFGG